MTVIKSLNVRSLIFSPSAGVNSILLSLLLWFTVNRLRRSYPPLDTEINADAYFTYLPNARKLLEAPWAFLTTDPRAYDVAPLTYIWPAILGADRASIQIANGALFLIGVVLFWAFVRSLGGSLAAFVATGLLVTHPEIVDYAPQVLTEAQYFFGLTLVMYAAVRAYASPETSARWLTLLAIGLSITLLTRPVLQYMLLLSIAALTAWLLTQRKRAKPQRQAKAWLIALMCSLVLPLAVVVKNGVYFGVWGLGTGSGTGLYYGVNPFKNGSDPAFSNFSYDAGVAPRAVDPDTEGHPLDKRSDAINRAVAMEIIKRTSVSDNLRFFGLKLRNWLFTSTPELSINPKFRIFRVLEWLTIGLGVSALAARRRAGHPLLLPGPHTNTRQKLTVYFLLLAAVFLMAAQLTPILYNTRYASYFIEPWLLALTGLSVAYWIQWGPAPRGIKRHAAMAFRCAVVLVLVYLAHQVTERAQRRETWRLDAYRPGPTASVLASDRFTSPQGEGMTLGPDDTWEFTQEPAILHLQVDTSSHPMQWPTLRDAMWRLRFALEVPGNRRPSRCGKILMTVEPHQDDLLWYTPPAWVYALPTSQANTYMLSANGAWRPAGETPRISLSFRCPVGTKLTWHGMEMRRSTMAEAARDFMLRGIPINPYLLTEP